MKWLHGVQVTDVRWLRDVRVTDVGWLHDVQVKHRQQHRGVTDRREVVAWCAGD